MYIVLQVFLIVAEAFWATVLFRDYVSSGSYLYLFALTIIAYDIVRTLVKFTEVE